MATLTINGGLLTNTAIFTGRIVDTNPTLNLTSTLGRVSVVKTGTNTQVLAGANTYTGTTTINGGAISVTGTLASPSALSVNSEGTIGGSGIIASPTNVNGTLAASGTLTFSSTLGIASTATLLVNFVDNGATATPFVVAGNTTISSGAAVDLSFDGSGSSVNFNDSFWSASHSFPILTAPVVSGTFVLGNVGSDSNGALSTGIGTFSLAKTGTSVVLNWQAYTPVEQWRFLYFGTIANSGNSADSADPDGDGYNNLAEFNAGTDPTDNTDYPGYLWTAPAGTLSWSGSANWLNGSVPVSYSGTRIEFLTGITPGAVTITSSNDLPGTFTLNRLSLGGTISTGTTTMQITGNPLQFLQQGASLPSVDLAASNANFNYIVSNNAALAATLVFNTSGSGRFIFSGSLSGTGGVTRNGSNGTLILSGSNSYSGPTTITAGTLQIGNDGATGNLGSGPVLNDGALRFDRSGSLTVPNSISGVGGITVSGPASTDVVSLTGSNSFAGTVTISGGALRITNSTGLGSGAKTINVNGTTCSLHLDGSGGDIVLPSNFTINSSNPNGSIVNDAGNNTVGGPINVTLGAGNSRFTSVSGTLTLAGNVAPNTSGRFLDLRGAGTGIIAGNLTDGGGANLLSALTKNESGNWTLSGSNSYSGSTTVRR